MGVFPVLLLAISAASFFQSAPTASAGIGFNWGTLQSHRLAPSVVVKLLRSNKIGKVKLFDADPQILHALKGSGIEVMVGVPNELLFALSSSPAAADSWVALNVSRYMTRGGVRIRYIAVGNEPFLASYQGQYQPFILPTLANLQQSLLRSNLSPTIKLVVPCNADAYQGTLPSQGSFRPDLLPLMTDLLSLLNSSGSPFVVNIYPFLSLYQSPDFPEDYAFFSGSTHSVQDNGNIYSNSFDGNYDTLVASLERIGYGQMPVVVGEVGWPTGGAASANATAARAFNQGLVRRVLRRAGTPLRPNSPPLDVYLFSLVDEDQKTVLPGNFEREWGVFSFDGQAKYPLDLGYGQLRNAEEVNYSPSRWCVANPSKGVGGGVAAAHVERACSAADCTALLYGGACNGLDEEGNVSYAFNSYYQLQRQRAESCEFDGLGMITFLDPSVGNCRFLVGLSDSAGSSRLCRGFCGFWAVFFWVFFVFRLMGFS
ncbi:O-Glycosyl hydrolases family 17 protein [Wolffia australiana]